MSGSAEERASRAAASVASLRAAGVEVVTRDDAAPGAAASLPELLPDAPPFTYVRLPADGAEEVGELSAPARAGDSLPALLAPCFASEQAMDPETVARETAARLKGMMIGGGAQEGGLKAPGVDSLQAASAGGACEAYPLAPPSADNGWQGVRLYIDEVGALRGRPRNARAEALAAAAGLAGLSIHGDAYVGRVGRRPEGGETNLPFAREELAPESAWATAARAAHGAAAAAAGHMDEEVLAGGKGAGYTWSQTEDEVEVRVGGAPSGPGAARRLAVTYGRGDRLSVALDGEPLLTLPRLFDRVSPDGCLWTLDGGEVVVTMEKAEERPWVQLTLPGAD
eukprot:jgi/Tetstr1/461370/TSEL_006494.t1